MFSFVTEIDSERSDICTWLEQTNPSEIHNNAVRDYEKGTGDWIDRTPQWQNWMSSKDRCLWVHGIPGAGKTVLTSYVIRKVIRTVEESGDPRSAYAYYYCHHAHNQDEAAAFLRWIVSQLCRSAQIVPEALYESHRLRLQPSLEELLRHLGLVLERFSRVFIVVDALDESQSRETLIRVIRDILSDPQFLKVQLFVTSREYIDIERAMESISTPISMSNQFVEEDIRTFVAARLKSSSIFQRWPEDFRTEVEEALSAGAKGMFRWAVCQLDILRRLKHQKKAREAIGNLPRTLDETYERIFSCIDPEDIEIVRHCLWWTMFHNSVWDSNVPLPAQVLIDTYYLTADDELADDNPLIPDIEILKESCGCLLSFTGGGDNFDDGVVSLAHYTVREYLQSSRALTGQSSLFARPGTGSALYEVEAAAVFKQLLKLEAEVDLEDMENYLEGIGEHPVFDDFGLMIAANTSVYRFFTGFQIAWVGKIAVESSLIFDFLDPQKPHFAHLANAAHKLYMHGCYESEAISKFTYLRLTPSDDPAGLGILANLLWIHRLDLAAKLLQRPGAARIWQGRLSGEVFSEIWNDSGRSFNYTPPPGNIVELFAFALTAGEESPDSLNFLLDHAQGHFNPTSVLIHYIGIHYHGYNETCAGDCPLRRLLGLGADPNARGYPCTPLQIAAIGRDLHGIQTLLQEGADRGATGSIEADDWEAGSALAIFSGLRGIEPLEIVKSLEHRALGGWRHKKYDDDAAMELLMGLAELPISE